MFLIPNKEIYKGEKAEFLIAFIAFIALIANDCPMIAQ
jgi:hypothetical protein